MFLSYVSVNGMALGLYLYEQKDSSVSVNIEKSGDSEDVKQVKMLLSLMIAKEASARPSIQEVVDNLAYLLTTLKAQDLQVPDIFKGMEKIVSNKHRVHLSNDNRKCSA